MSWKTVRGNSIALRLSALFPKIELMKKSLGSVDGGIALDGRGQSVAQILATANGEARLYVREGVMSSLLLDMAGLNLGSVIVTKLFGQDKEVRLRCAIADVPIRDGVAYMQNVKVNTEEAQQLGARLNIRSIPTLALFVGGREVARQAGAMGAADIVRWTQAHLPR